MSAPSDTAVAQAPQLGPAAAADRPSPIKVKKIGHLVYEVSDVERSTKFWTEVMGFKVSDRNDHGMVFLRTNADHHGIGLKPGKAKSRPERKAGLAIEHIALEVDNIDALFAARAYLRAQGVPIVWEGRKGGGLQLRRDLPRSGWLRVRALLQHGPGRRRRPHAPAVAVHPCRLARGRRRQAGAEDLVGETVDLPMRLFCKLFTGDS
jgi:catechol 2,3-dioxygenase-like lactoylglutathione lyase family enzyme